MRRALISLALPLIDPFTFWVTTLNIRLHCFPVRLFIKPGCCSSLQHDGCCIVAPRHRTGKQHTRTLPTAVSRFNELVLADGFQHLAVNHIHALQAGCYQQAHRDPFDRILLAQASIEGLNFLSCDAELKPFGVKLIW